MHKHIGFIGCGRLGQALRGWLSRGAVLPDHVILSAKSTAEATAADFGVRSGSIQDVVDQAEVIILAVKPYQAQAVLKSLDFSPEKLLVSTMAGVTSKDLGVLVSPGRIIRTMPNVGCRIGLGATLLHAGPRSTVADVQFVTSLFENLGFVECLEDESYFHGGTGLSEAGQRMFLWQFKRWQTQALPPV